jgi:hypothetical protein
MKLPLWMRLGGFLAVLLVAAFLIHEQLSWRKERAQLQEQISASQKQVQDADARQRARDAELHDALRQVAQRKAQVQTPEQIIRELPRDLPLPSPIVLAPWSPASKDAAPGLSSSTQKDAAMKSGAAQPGSAVIPAEDLKPLFDYVQDCKACKAELTAARKDLGDEHIKTGALEQECDAALKLARGGGFWRRAARAAKWFALGAAAGAAAAAAR